jgi:sugar phosphate isomerase/epimerase
MDRIGIEPLSVFGLPPVAFVELAADLGCAHIGVALTSPPYNPHGYPPWSLRDDVGLRREMMAAMRDRDVAVSLGDGFVVREGADMRERAADVEIMAELGAPRVNTVSFDPDRGRTIDQFGTVVELAAASGMETTLELVPGTTVPDLDAALHAIEEVARPDFRLLVDTMHLVRSGAGADDLAALDAEVFGYVQLSDVPLVPTSADYMQEAVFERMVPGTGELPLFEILDALPRHLVIGLEVPMRSEAEAGVGPRDRVGRCVDATRSLIARLDGDRH